MDGVLTIEQCDKLNPVSGHVSFDNHEQIVFCYHKESNLKAIIGIHNTVLGPALGGARVWKYNNEWEALNDVLRLSRGMTFKNSLAGLNLGGGKSVIIADSKTEKTPEMIIEFAKYVDSLSGRYLTAEDVGSTTNDMNLIQKYTRHVLGVSPENGGSGDPSPVTAYGVYMGMKAAAKYKFGNDNLAGKKILIQGVGHVGEVLISYLVKENATVQITDINPEKLQEINKKYGATIFKGGDIYAADVDIYSPCALGATVNDECIQKLKAKVIAGSANNQLAVESIHGKMLREKGIVYAPDFLINAGGVINVYGEIEGYGIEEAMKRTENIYHTTLEILKYADSNDITTQQAAISLAQQRIDKNKKKA